MLLVEDDDGVRMVTAQALKALGYEVDLAEEGATALRCLAGERPYDAVVTDVRMPVMGGLELVRAMRANGNLTPVLLVSGYSIEDVAAFCRSQPHIRSLGKPWSPQELNDAVEALIATAAPPSEFASPKVSLIR